MISFKVSAPRKLILYGEHAAVYGTTALAGSLDLRTTLEFEELSRDQLHIYLSLPKISLFEKVSLKNIEDHFFRDDNSSIISFDSNKLYEHVENFVEKIVGYSNLSQKLALEAFFYLFVSVLKSGDVSGVKPFRVHVDTTLSVSSGLGSSASFAVTLTTCFLHYVQLRKGGSTTLDKAKLDEISKFALQSEKIMHGNTSGIDTAVCTYGSMVEFRKNETLRPIDDPKSLRVLLVDTKVPRSTKALVEKVAQLKDKYPKIYEPILQSIDNVSLEASDIIKKMKVVEDSMLNDLYEDLMTLIDVNQNLLAACQVSHPTIDGICVEARKHSLRAKLTGAGGGGYTYVLLRPDTTDETVKEITEKFENLGYEVTQTNLGGPGVRIES